MGTAQPGESCHIRQLPEQVDGHDGGGIAGHRRGGRGSVQVEGSRLDVREYGARTDIVNRTGRREKGEGRGHDLISPPDIQRAQGQQNRVRSARAANGMGYTQRLRHLGLEAIYRRSQDEPLLADQGLHGGENIVRNALMLRDQVEQRNGKMLRF
jgi:hypothetical protein